MTGKGGKGGKGGKLPPGEARKNIQSRSAKAGLQVKNKLTTNSSLLAEYTDS